jgi:hypothetical protein
MIVTYGYEIQIDSVALVIWSFDGIGVCARTYEKP